MHAAASGGRGMAKCAAGHHYVRPTRAPNQALLNNPSVAFPFSNWPATSSGQQLAPASQSPLASRGPRSMSSEPRWTLCPLAGRLLGSWTANMRAALETGELAGELSDSQASWLDS